MGVCLFPWYQSASGRKHCTVCNHCLIPLQTHRDRLRTNVMFLPFQQRHCHGNLHSSPLVSRSFRWIHLLHQSVSSVLPMIRLKGLVPVGLWGDPWHEQCSSHWVMLMEPHLAISCAVKGSPTSQPFTSLFHCMVLKGKVLARSEMNKKDSHCPCIYFEGGGN